MAIEKTNLPIRAKKPAPASKGKKPHQLWKEKEKKKKEKKEEKKLELVLEAARAEGRQQALKELADRGALPDVEMTSAGVDPPKPSLTPGQELRLKELLADLETRKTALKAAKAVRKAAKEEYERTEAAMAVADNAYKQTVGEIRALKGSFK